MKRKNKTILALSLCAGLAVGVGALSTVENVKTASAESASFYVFDGASIRLSSDSMGIRFEAFLSESAKTAVQNGAEFGMLVMSEANYNSSTDWLNDYANNDKVKKFVYGADELGTNDGEQEENTTAYPIRVRAAITKLQFDSANQDLVAVGYLKNGDSIEYDSSYNTPSADGVDGARSIAQVAELARKAYDEAEDKTEFNFGTTELAWLDEMVQKGYANDQGMDYNGTEYVLGTETYQDWKTPFVNQVAIYDGETEVSEVTLQKAVVVDGDVTEKQLTAKLVNFGKVSDETFEWSVNGEAVTVVDGKISFANVGTATVTATCGEYSASVVVNAEKTKIDASSITLTDLETWGTNEAGKTLINVAPFTALNANGTTGAGETLALNLTDKAYTGDTKTAIDVEFENAVYTGVQANLITKAIDSYEGLMAMKSYGTVTEATSDGKICKLDGYFVLTQNIDLAGNKITSDFTKDAVDEALGFIGTFDGRGYNILGGTYGEFGIFGQIGTTGVVKNLAILDATLYYSGTLAYRVYGTLQDVLVTCTESSQSWGIAYSFGATAKVTNVVAYSKGTVKDSHPYCMYGAKNATFTNCYSISEDGLMCYSGDQASSVTKMTWTTVSKSAFTGFDSDMWVFNDDGTAYFKKLGEFYQPQLDAVDMSAVTSLKAGESVTISGIPAGAVLSTDNEYVTVSNNNTLTVATNFTESFTCNVILSMYSATRTVQLQVIYFDAVITEEQVYELYTGLNGSDRIANTAAFTVSLDDGKTVKTGGTWYLTNGDNTVATDIVSAEGNVLTINRDNLAVGEYTLTYEHAEQSIKVPFIIATKAIDSYEELMAMKSYGTVTEATSDGKICKLDGYFVLTQNINLAGNNITSDFTKDAVDEALGFIGTFNGRGYSLLGGTYGEFGIFGQIGTTGVVKNLAILDATLYYSGTLAYKIYGTVENVLVTCTESYYAWGLAYYFGATAKFTNVVAYSKGSASDSHPYCLYGAKNATFTNCYSISEDGLMCYTGDQASSVTKMTWSTVSKSSFTGFDETMWKFNDDGTATFVKAE